MAEEDDDKLEAFKERFEMLCGVILAIFAAVLAITDLGAGKYGDDEMIAHNERTTALAWYNAKGVKESLAEGQRSILDAMLQAGTVAANQQEAVKKVVAELDSEIARYKREKKEILLGSKAVGEANWAQDINGEMGKIIGAQEWEAKATVLGDAGDVFDRATLYLQMCLVLGALSLILRQVRLKWLFFGAMMVTGGIGKVYCLLAYMAAWKV